MLLGKFEIELIIIFLAARTRDPDLAVVELNGAHYKKMYEQMSFPKTSIQVQTFRMWRDHPGVRTFINFEGYFLKRGHLTLSTD